MKNTAGARRVTISDVSEAAGCSKGVVSAVVNNAKGNISVSPKTRERVMEAAARLGYRPNFASRSLARKSTRTIGIYVPPYSGASLGYGYEGRILRGIEEACRECDYDLLVLNVSGALSPEQCQHRFTEGRIDGLLLLRAPNQADWVTALVAWTPNVVAVNYHGDVPLKTVSWDNLAAARMAVEHLLSLGHRRIAFIGSVSHDLGVDSWERIVGYRQAMAAAGLELREDWVWDQTQPRFTGGRVQRFWANDDVPQAIDHLLSLGDERPTAAVCSGDLHAIKAIQYMASRGLSVPGDLSLIGFDDSDLAPRIFPPLSSVRQPLEDMGRRAASLLINRAEYMAPGAPPAESDESLWPPTLVVRESTVPPTTPE